MKKYFFTLISFVLPIWAMAQINNAEDYNVGDQLHYMICTMPDSPGSAGMAIMWDFSSVLDSGNGQRTTWVLDDNDTAAPPGNMILSFLPYVSTNGFKIQKTATQNLLILVLQPPVTYTYDAGVL